MSYFGLLIQSLETIAVVAAFASVTVGCLWATVVEASAREALRARVVVFAALGTLAVVALLAGLPRTGLWLSGFWAVYLASVAALPAWNFRPLAASIAFATGVLSLIAVTRLAPQFAALRGLERLSRVEDVDAAAQPVIDALERYRRETGQFPRSVDELVESGSIRRAQLRVSADSSFAIEDERFAAGGLCVEIAPARVRADRLWWSPDRSVKLGPNAWRRGDWVYFDDLDEGRD
jgi:hypothetical protein